MPQVYINLLFCSKVASIWYLAQWNLEPLAVA